MEGGGGSIATGNVPLSAVTAAVLRGSERAYDRGSPLLDHIDEINSSATISSTATIPNDIAGAAAIVDIKKEGTTVIRGQDKAVAGCSASMACSSSADILEASGSITTSVKEKERVATTITEPGYPIVGSPPADLMVVNTNGFNPLQHAALRGNPG